jgi:hypothetical protein
MTASAEGMADLRIEGMLPCPFCGSTGRVVHGPGEEHFPMCNGEDCPLRLVYSTGERAIAAWNRRAHARRNPQTDAELNRRLIAVADMLMPFAWPAGAFSTLERIESYAKDIARQLTEQRNQQTDAPFDVDKVAEEIASALRRDDLHECAAYESAFCAVTPRIAAILNRAINGEK